MPFKCLQCGEHFLKPSHLQAHRTMMDHWRNLSCNVCGKLCSRKDALTRHLNTHMHTNGVACEECGKIFSRRDGMLRHRKMFHVCVKPRDIVIGFGLQTMQRRHFENFNTTVTSYKLSFDEMIFQNVSDVHIYSVSLLDEVIRRVTPDWKIGDYVQLSFENENVCNTMSTPFLPVNQLTGENILSTAESMYQAKENLFLNQSIKVDVSRIDLPIGGGRQNKFADLDRFLKEKQCVIRITNVDEICCARAIVTAKARLDKHEKWNNIRQGRTIQEELARELHRNANVPIGVCGIEEIKKMQTVLPGYQIHVVSKEHMNTVIYSGPKADKKIYLYLHDQHFDVITSMPAFMSRNYFCDVCHKGYDHQNSHKCINTCTACQKVHESTNENPKYCQDCNRVFKGKECFELHKKRSKMGNSVCSNCYICKECDQIVRPKYRSSKHRCGEKFCKRCADFFPSDHQCYMIPIREKENVNKNYRKIFIFFDFKCCQNDVIQCQKGYAPNKTGKRDNFLSSSCGTLQHVPNLCVVHKICTLCMNQDVDEKSECRECGRHEHVFSGPETVSDFCRWLFSGKNYGATVLAHNFKDYYSHPILKYLFDNNITPQVVPTGTKSISLVLKTLGIRMIDSMNFLPMALAKLPEAFGFQELEKGYFPHLFNRKENQEAMLDHLPDMAYYNPDSMMPSDREKFVHWYSNHKNDPFDFQRELLRYCRLDVDILRKCVMRFRNDFLEITDVDPVSSCLTIASACYLVFQRNFLKPETIAVIPSRGYNLEQVQSRKALQWLRYVAHTTGYQVQHVGNGTEKVIGRYRVDGYYETSDSEKVVLEFHGDFWHGNPEKYSTDLQHPIRKKTMGQLYQETLDKKQFIEDRGYKYISIWESEWDRRVKEDQNVSQFVQHLDIVTPLQPREAFYGGRTETFTLYRQASENETIHYYDVTSFYAFINKTGKVPLGHPVIITEEFGDLAQYEGLIKCKIVPPRDLYMPVLPSNINGRLLFTLCKTCAETQNTNRCLHFDHERALIGSWVTDEVKKAVEQGYVVEKIYEIWHFTNVARYDPVTKTGGVFTDYVNTFLKVKQEASGWPSWCVSEQDKQCYIELYEEKEGIKLDYDKIVKNPGRRALAKLCLNILWGKLGQRDNLSHVDFVRDPKVLFDHLTSSDKKVTSLKFVSDEIVAMNWQQDDDFVETSGKTNVVIAAYTTAQARLKLYSYLERLNTRMLYCDTDSIVYFSMNGDSNPSLGDYLGDLTDEIPKGNAIQKFVSCGPKNYAYQLQQPNEDGSQTCCKIRGITMNNQTRLDIDYDTIDRMVRSDISDNTTVTTTKVSSICRDKQTTTLLTKVVSKDYRIAFDKRVRIDNYGSVPYGF